MPLECSVCHTDNPDDETHCASCGNVLLGTQSGSDVLEPSWVVVCPICGHEHAAENENAKVLSCEFCADETDKLAIAKERPRKVLPSKGKEPEISASAEIPASKPILQLKDLDSKSAMTVRIDGDCLIGRKGDVETEFFASDPYVSEYHCKVHLVENEYYVEHLPTTNGMELNSVKLAIGIRTRLRNGEYLKIADKTFEVAISHAD
jgi:DNA-directed RNA polymerase subunit M/transcription elongation factor TFIIS